MKHYPKRYDDISYGFKSDSWMASHIGSSLGTVDELALKYRNFYREAHMTLFDLIIKEVWLEQKFLFNGARRSARSGNGLGIDRTFGYFIKKMVGISQKPLTDGMVFMTVPTYFVDFFPNFSDHDPFVETDYFKYPYQHVTLDHLSFVYQCHNRLELLKEAEEKSMKISDFYNWATNWAYCYNDEVGEIVYRIARSNYTPYIKKMNKKNGRK